MSAALCLYRDVVRPEWVDYNEHFSDGYYAVVFGEASDAFLAHVGLGRAYRARGPHSTYTLECHLAYHRELHLGAPFAVETRVLDCDAKRFHILHRLTRSADGMLAASGEFLFMHVDTRGPRAAPFPDEVQARLRALQAAHAALPAVATAGGPVGIRRRAA